MDNFAIDLSKLPYAFLLVLSIVFLSYISHLRAERELVDSSIRTTVQLILVGYMLKTALNVKSVLLLLLALVVMSFIASFVAVERLNLDEPFLKSWCISFISLNASTGIVFIFLLLLSHARYSPLEFIILWGLILGNSLSNVGLAFERLKSETKGRLSEIEAKVALGAPLKLAMRELMQRAIRASMMPKYNMLKSAGVVHIPGVAVGMIVAGAEPIKAMVFQIVVMLVILSVGFLTSYLVINLTYKSALRSLGGRT